MKPPFKMFQRALLLFTASTFSLFSNSATIYDVVINHGRVVDPQTGLDSIRNVGISHGKIMAISKSALSGKRIIDAKDRIVSPGFIDLHGHAQDILSTRVQAFDGVTTALELEAGMTPIQEFYSNAAQQGRPINYGASVNWAGIRSEVVAGMKPKADLRWVLEVVANHEWRDTILSATQIEQVVKKISEELDEGGLGIGILSGYAPNTGVKEFYAVNALAASRNVPTFTHARYLSMTSPNSSLQGIAQILAAAAGTGVHAHIVHLNSISLRDIDVIAPMITEAQHQGLNVTTEAYPYGAAESAVGAAMFRGEGWREKLGGVTANNFVINGKRLSESEFAHYQAESPATPAIVKLLDVDTNPKDKAALDKSVLLPGGVIASDSGPWVNSNGTEYDQLTWPLPTDALNHPRSAGTFSRFLRLYLKENKQVNLLEAIRRVSFGPAHILEKEIPSMRYKGRIQVGADADIVVFNLATVVDKASYQKPAQLSEGFDYVIVNGVVLIDNGVLNTHVMPGKPVRNPIIGS